MTENTVSDLTRSELRGTIQSAILTANIATAVLFGLVAVLLKVMF